MASIYKRKDKEGKVTVWRAVVRIKGYPTVCNHFDRKQEAEDWAADVEREHVHMAGFLGQEMCATAALVPDGEEMKMQRVALKASSKEKESALP